MLLRKKTQLRIAYVLLAATAVSVVGYDSARRSGTARDNVQSQPPSPQPTASALPIVPLAQSPFPEASLANFHASESVTPRTEPEATATHEPRSTPSGVYFLTVAVEVPSKNGPVALNRGTRVHLVREQDGKLRVRRKSTDFLIEKSQVTDDLRVVAALARSAS